MRFRVCGRGSPGFGAQLSGRVRRLPGTATLLNPSRRALRLRRRCGQQNRGGIIQTVGAMVAIHRRVGAIAIGVKEDHLNPGICTNLNRFNTLTMRQQHGTRATCQGERQGQQNHCNHM